jgi:predicted ATP-dependent endonuclease of OLD family
MYISRIVVRHFRNFELLDVPISPGATCLIGENNTGKSNLLFALRLAIDANLEYYLKYVLTAILENLTNNKAMSSLTELYDRIGYSFECLQRDLGAKQIDYHDSLLRGGEHQALPCT